MRPSGGSGGKRKSRRLLNHAGLVMEINGD